MGTSLSRWSLSYAAGTVGALLNSLGAWLFGLIGLSALMGVKIVPALTTAFLYPRLVWGGLWGFLFLIPILRDKWVLRGLLWSLAPTLVQLLYIFPFKAGKGMMGFDLGTMTPAFVLLCNVIWGLAASWWMDLTDRGPSRK
jgi:hypothetical protein